MKNKKEFNTSIYKYMVGIGANPRQELLTVSPEKVLSQFNDFFHHSVFKYSLETISHNELSHSTDVFICNDNGLVANFYEAFHGSVIKRNGLEVNMSIDDFAGKTLYQVKCTANAHTPQLLYEDIIFLTPKFNYFLVPLVIFGLLSPLFANLFNSRLVYTESVLTFWFVTSFFLLFVFFEYILKKQLKNKTTEQVQKNMHLISDYFFHLFKFTNANNISTKVKSIEQAAQYFWENRTLMYTDFAFLFVYVLCVVGMLKMYSSILIVFYLCAFFLMYKKRFLSYSVLLKKLEITGEKSSFLYSFETKKKEFNFIEPSSIQKLFVDKYGMDELNRNSLDYQNHEWSELIKVMSFLSMVLMYFSSYLALQYDNFLMSNIIALMIINSRLSSSLFSVINKFYLMKVQKHHFFESASVLLQDCRDPNGIKVKNIESVKCKNLSCDVFTRNSIEPLSFELKKGNSYAVIGPSGSGKTTLLSLLSGQNKLFDGDVYLNGVSVKNVDSVSLGKEIAFHYGNIDFLKMSLKKNFEFYGIIEMKEVLKCLEFASPKFELDFEKFESLDADCLGFSNGEKQKLLLAMVTSKKPSLIILDESTSFLSAIDAVKTIDWLMKNNPDSIILFATHDMTLANKLDHTLPLSLSRKKNKVYIA